MRLAVGVLILAACSSSKAGGALDAPGASDASDATIDAPPVACTDVTDAAALAIGTAATADDYAVTITARSASATSWGTTANEALILEVSGATRGFIGHLVMHQGDVAFPYTMHLGALAAGETVSVRVSTLSAVSATRSACVAPAALVSATELGAAAPGLVNAPEYRWPVQKRFDDIPIVVGWSKTRKSYQTVFTNEDGGTVVQCGGGAGGIQAEIARWGRASDIEGSYGYAAAANWERCDGSVPQTTTPLRLEGAHPRLYYGDGHNRVFESRGGYGQTCGTGGPEKANGDLAGWNVTNPGNELANDAGRVIVLRPLPVDLDALGYAQFGGRREGLGDRYAPWLYRITALELAREAKVDNAKTFGMARYLYVDVRVADVGGSGDQYCSTLAASSGFKVHAVTATGTDFPSAQITGDYVSGHDYKRVAIPIAAGVTAADIDHFVFDAYDNDGIYFTALGDAFIPQPHGTNGATLDVVHAGETAYADYVDDDSSGCTGGNNTGGPGGTPYACVGGQVVVPR